jgi:F0F1-type ATP synthase assembly protein I
MQLPLLLHVPVGLLEVCLTMAATVLSHNPTLNYHSVDGHLFGLHQSRTYFTSDTTTLGLGNAFFWAVSRFVSHSATGLPFMVAVVTTLRNSGAPASTQLPRIYHAAATQLPRTWVDILHMWATLSTSVLPALMSTLLLSSLIIILLQSLGADSAS